MNDEAEKLFELHEMAKAGKLDGLSSWVTDSLDGYLFGSADNLDQAFGVNGKNGGRKAKTVLLQAKRDKYILDAWEAVSDDENITPWSRSKLLAKEVNTFISIVWLRVCFFDHPPKNYSELRKSLFYATKSGNGKLPMTAKGLHLIVSNAMPKGIKL